MAVMPTPEPAPGSLIKAFGIPPARIAVIRAIQQVGTAGADQIMEATGLSRSTLSWHLKPLEEAGILLSEVDPARAGAHSGCNNLLFRLDEEALKEKLQALQADLIET